MDRQVLTQDHLEIVKLSSFLNELEDISFSMPELADLMGKEAMPNLLRPLSTAAKAVGTGVKGAVGTVSKGLHNANIMAHAIHAGAHGPEVFEGAEKIVHGIIGGHPTTGLINAAPHFYGAGRHAFNAHVVPAARAAGSAVASRVGRVLPRMPGPPMAPMAATT